MITFDLKINTPDYNKYFKEINKKAEKALVSEGYAQAKKMKNWFIREYISSTEGKKTLWNRSGHLKSNIDTVSKVENGQFQFGLEFDNENCKYMGVHIGEEEHTTYITPKKARALAIPLSTAFTKKGTERASPEGGVSLRQRYPDLKFFRTDTSANLIGFLAKPIPVERKVITIDKTGKPKLVTRKTEIMGERLFAIVESVRVKRRIILSKIRNEVDFSRFTNPIIEAVAKVFE